MTIDIRRILVPVDVSESTPPLLLEWAAHLAKEHGSAVKLEGAYLPPDFWDSVKSEAEESMQRLASGLEAQGIQVESAVCEGYPATVIAEEAASREADLIVIGTHGLSGLKHMLLGSIAERVVQKAPCPILTVKPPPA
jgi:nucleotide-binding universal stress UspA family protein